MRMVSMATFADGRHGFRHGRQLARDFKAALLGAGAIDKTDKAVVRQAILDSRSSWRSGYRSAPPSAEAPVPGDEL
jgi:hypothetical protein